MSTIASLAGRPLALRREVLDAILRDLAAGRIAAVRQEPPRPTARARPGVAVLQVYGTLEHRPGFLAELFGLGTSTADLRQRVRALAADPEIGTIVLDIDSPGGEVDGITELAAAIRAARSRKPVIAIADAIAASAALWIGSQASEFVVTPSGSVGSLGVYGVHQDVSVALDKLGVKVTMVYAGRYKVERAPYAPLTAEAKGDMQNEVDHYLAMFVDDVAMGRRLAPSRVASGFGEGRMLMPRDALAAGMVDRIGTLDEVLSEASGRAATARAGFEAELSRARLAATRSRNASPRS